MAQHTPKSWRYEEGTKTIRSVPENYWIASIDSWDGAVDHIANARLIAAAPDLLEAISAFVATADEYNGLPFDVEGTKAIKRNAIQARAAIARARGEG